MTFFPMQEETYHICYTRLGGKVSDSIYVHNIKSSNNCHTHTCSHTHRYIHNPYVNRAQLNEVNTYITCMSPQILHTHCTISGYECGLIDISLVISQIKVNRPLPLKYQLFSPSRDPQGVRMKRCAKSLNDIETFLRM